MAKRRKYIYFFGDGKAEGKMVLVSSRESGLSQETRQFLQDLKQPVEKNSPPALSLDMRTDFNRGQFATAFAPIAFLPVVALVVLAASERVMCPV